MQRLCSSVVLVALLLSLALPISAEAGTRRRCPFNGCSPRPICLNERRCVPWPCRYSDCARPPICLDTWPCRPLPPLL